jgi:hypothetical protein
MSKLTGLQRLYPHLQFNHIQPQTRSRSEPSIPLAIPDPVSTVIQKPVEKVTEPEKPQIVEPVKEPSPKPEPPKEKIKKVKSPTSEAGLTSSTSLKKTPKKDTPKKVEIVEPPTSEAGLTSSTSLKKTSSKPKPKPKGEPLRDNPIPKLGEKGLQRKYSMEQRKQLYLDQLSKKSVKRAEQEVSKVNAVLEKVEHSPTLLAMEEKEIKNRLKLINTAKFFIVGKDNNIIENDNDNEKRDLHPRDEKKGIVSQQEESSESSDESRSDQEC